MKRIHSKLHVKKNTCNSDQNFQYDHMKDTLLTHSPIVLLKIITSKHPYKASRNGLKEKQKMKKQLIKKLMKV